MEWHPHSDPQLLEVQIGGGVPGRFALHLGGVRRRVVNAEDLLQVSAVGGQWLALNCADHPEPVRLRPRRASDWSTLTALLSALRDEGAASGSPRREAIMSGMKMVGEDAPDPRSPLSPATPDAAVDQTFTQPAALSLYAPAISLSTSTSPLGATMGGTVPVQALQPPSKQPQIRSVLARAAALLTAAATVGGIVLVSGICDGDAADNSPILEAGCSVVEGAAERVSATWATLPTHSRTSPPPVRHNEPPEPRNEPPTVK